MPAFARAAAIGSISGLLGIAVFLTPMGQRLEESVGLDILFELRGPKEPPHDVVIVDVGAIHRGTIARRASSVLDKECAAAAGARVRCAYAALLRRIATTDPAVVVVDVAFREPGDGQADDALVHAVEAAGNVLLLERIERRTAGSDAPLQDTIVPPFPRLQQAALGTAPFPLPKYPVTVRQFWTFKSELGDAPTLPAMALHAYLARTAGTFESAPAPGESLRGRMQALRRMVDGVDGSHRYRDEFSDGEPPAALVALYRGPESRIINFHGPPGTIRTISASDILAADEEAPDVGGLLTGRAVFVGVSDRVATDQLDGFPTVFTTADGIDISGVEIAATAFANLLAERSIERATNLQYATALMIFGLLCGAAFAVLSPAVAAALGVVIFFAVLGAAYAAFASADFWPPLAIPTLVQIPVALLLGIASQYLLQKRARSQAQTALSYYVPPEALDHVMDRGAAAAGGETVFGICLATDVQGFTEFAERQSPAELQRTMNRYFDLLSAPVAAHGGRITDVVADSVMCLWQSLTPETARGRDACLAAIDMRDAVARFNAAHASHPLPTRFGLHAGWVSFGNIGGGGHYAYSVLGDIANTASRIEALNKHLGTTILLSSEVTAGLDDLVLRRLGVFRLKGKSEPVAIHELIGRRDSIDDAGALARHLAAFEDALGSAEAGQWSVALDLFQSILTEFPDDGAARFHHQRCRDRADGSSANIDPAIIAMDRK